ncbi:endonuclease V, partial [Streptomyces violascens]
MKITGIPPAWPDSETVALAMQDELRGKVVLDEPGPAPGSGLVTGVDVAYDDERDLGVAAARGGDAASRGVVGVGPP